MGGFQDSFIYALHDRCEALGADASAEQKARLVEWIVQCVPQDQIAQAGEMALMYGCNVFTECSMRAAEFGY